MHVITAERRPGDFSELADQVRKAGLLDRRPAYYGVKIGLTVLALAAGWGALVVVGNSWDALGVAAFLGVVFTQLGFIGHDAGHLQVFRTRRANWLLGLGVGNALMGVSYGWWVPKHGAHHAFPNQIGRDPDLATNLGPPPSADAAGVVASDDSNPSATWLVWLFFPLMLLRSTGLHVLGIQRLLKNRDRSAATEGALIALHAAFYLSIVFWVLSPLKALAFIAVQQGVFSLYLGCSFAPNHKGMPVIAGDAELSFVRRQVTTSRNVVGGWTTNFLLGGLNYQIEHHLFPSMPRPNLARAQGIVRPFCLESGLDYCEESFVDSFRHALRPAQLITRASSLVATH